MTTRRYNAKVFGGKLPADLQITWSKTLCTTAGLTHYSRSASAEGGGQWKCAQRR
jgi:SprT-like family